MNELFSRLMREATRLTQSGNLTEATAAIQRALGRRTGPADGAVEKTVSTMDLNPGEGAAALALPRLVGPAPFVIRPPLAPSPTVGERIKRPEPSAEGSFTAGSHTYASLTRKFKLYVPPGASDLARPMVVMLHGCTQDPDDFATGTAMNELGEEQGFFVLYPEQSRAANPSRCWNWFSPEHQRRDAGEPAVLADMTRAVIAQHGIDPQRVYIAGLSAGGAMAAIVAAAYPDIFAALGVHSGLPLGAASDVNEALMVMKNGRPGATRFSMGRGLGVARPQQSQSGTPVPTIVFHGDADRTVHPRNGEQVIAAALDNAESTGGPQPREAVNSQVEQGVTVKGSRYTRSTHAGESGATFAEHWVVHGAGHAWSGGNARGSHTDAKGPDASREMLRFFLEHPMADEHSN